MANGSDSVAASIPNFDEEIKKLMGKGKVHMVCGEFLDAVKCFEDATKRLDEKYGQAADECGEAYFYYGKSLLEVARMEGGVLGNALQGALDSNTQENGGETTSEQNTEDKNKQESTAAKSGPTEGTLTDNKTTIESDLFVGPDISELDEDEKEKIGKDVTDAMTEDAFKEAIEEDKPNKDDKTTSEKDSSDKDEPMLEKTDDTSEKDDTTSQVQEVAKASGDKTQQEESESDNKEEAEQEEENKDDNKDTTEGEEIENAEDEDEPMEAEDVEVEGVEQCADEEEPTYMELAWQMLEISRIIFKRREEKEKLMLAQCHLKLGEIQMEQEQFLGAVEDFLKCIDIQKLYLSPDDRLLAETAYNIGLAFSFQSMYDKSKDYYSLALETIGLRIKSLQQNIEEAESKSKGKEKATPDNPFVANRKELQELQELYPEIKAKVDDAEDMGKQSKKPSISSVMGNGSTTTIGFGHSSTCSSAAQPVTMIATKKKTPITASDSQPATVIAVKKKTPVAAADISHLMHRNKRKPEEAEDDDTVAKKPRQDPDVCKPNGKAATAET